MTIAFSQDSLVRQKILDHRSGLISHLVSKFYHRKLNNACQKTIDQLLSCQEKQTCKNCADPTKNCPLYPALEVRNYDDVIHWISGED